MVLIKWYGHSCFEVRNALTILIDPHDGVSLGLPVPTAKPDIVLVSHVHSDHASGISLVTKPTTTLIDKPINYFAQGVEIKGIETFHDDSKGSRLGLNILYYINLEGLSFLHLGDLGHVLSSEHIHEFGNVDILMINVGGKLLLADENIRKIKPKIVIPMHYKTEGIIFPYYPLADINKFLKNKDKIKLIQKSETIYKKKNLPKNMEINVFSI